MVCWSDHSFLLLDCGILVSSDVFIPMLCTPIQFGPLPALRHLVMSIVVAETCRWVQFLWASLTAIMKSSFPLHALLAFLIVIVMTRCLYPQLYLTDLATRESLLLCTEEHPVLQLALHDDSIWIATTDSSVHRWPIEGRNPQKVFQRGGSFLAGNLSFSRARVSLEGSTPVNDSPPF